MGERTTCYAVTKNSVKSLIATDHLFYIGEHEISNIRHNHLTKSVRVCFNRLTWKLHEHEFSMSFYSDRITLLSCSYANRISGSPTVTG